MQLEQLALSLKAFCSALEKNLEPGIINAKKNQLLQIIDFSYPSPATLKIALGAISSVIGLGIYGFLGSAYYIKNLVFNSLSDQAHTMISSYLVFVGIVNTLTNAYTTTEICRAIDEVQELHKNIHDNTIVMLQQTPSFFTGKKIRENKPDTIFTDSARESKPESATHAVNNFLK